MSFSGDLHTMALPDILEWVARHAKTGTLQVQYRSTQKRMTFRQGTIYSSWSNDPRETLGQALIREGLITEEELFKALLRQEQQGRLLGAILVSEGHLTGEQLKRALRMKAEELVYDLFLWPDGRFAFDEGAFPRDVLINLEMDVSTVLVEGARRVREWQVIRSRFPSTAVTFRLQASQGGGERLEDARERQLLALATAGKSLAEISLETRRSEFDTASGLFSLCERGILAVDQMAEEPLGTDLVGAIGELLKLAEQRFEEKRYDAALEAYEEVLSLDRLNQTAKKGLLAIGEARKRVRLLKRVPLDKVPVLRKSPSALTQERFDPQEGFVLSRVNGQWDVQSILKLCPIPEEEALLIFARLLDRKVIDL
jgi:hypothetical protein